MRKRRNQNRLSSAELASFCGQIALILESGIPLYDGMETLAQTAKDSEIYLKASRNVTAKGSLYEALKEDKSWPGYLVEMIRIGEHSGHLDKVMRGLESYYEREEHIHSSLIGAVTYPMVLGVLLVVIVVVLMWKVMPVFERVLGNMGIVMNDSGNVMMNIGAALGWVVLGLVAAALISIVACAILLRTRHRTRVLAVLQRLLPPLFQLRKKLSASRAAGVMSLMIEAGFHTDDALEMTRKVLDDRYALDQLGKVSRHLEEGKTFAQAVCSEELFDELQKRMIVIGSSTGNEHQVLGKIADLNEEQAEEDMSRLISIVEPTLVVMLALIIGVVLLSVMLSVAGMLTSL